MNFEIINPEELGTPKGWNNGILAPAGGRVLFVAGQIASDASGRVPTDDFVDQFGRALQNVVTVVEAAGGTAACIGRLTIYVTDLAAYRAGRKAIGATYRSIMGRHFPAIALVEVRGLLEPGACVEIEATAIV